MLNDTSFEEYTPVWKWNSIEGKVNLKNEKLVAQFGKQIILQNTNPITKLNEDSNLSIQIEAKGSLQFDEDQGWKWHKSWILPDIKVTMDIKTSLGQVCLPPLQTYIEIFQVKQAESPEWESVGMRGISKVLTNTGKVEFGKGLKLSQTSYGHQGSRFYIVIAGYILDGGLIKSIFSYASPSIFVDSRKSDREFKIQRELNFTDLFCPEILVKSLHKQVLQQHQIEIINSPQGFYNFITASNLRNKIKHPVYLAIKFSSVFQLTCKEKEPSDKQLLLYLERLQTNLVYKQQDPKETEGELILMVKSFKNFKRNRKLNESLKHLSTLLRVVREDKCFLEDIKDYFTISPDQLTRVYSNNQIHLQTTLRAARSNVYKKLYNISYNKLKEKKEIKCCDVPQELSYQEIDLKKVKTEFTESKQIQQINPFQSCNLNLESLKFLQMHNFCMQLNMMRSNMLLQQSSFH